MTILEQPHPLTATTGTLQVRGARTNNLRNVDVEIPLRTLTVITGVSGSGKSSLAFETIYASGLSRLLESLPQVASKLQGRIPQPAVERITGLPPVVAVSQQRGRIDALSTVATLGALLEPLRVIYAQAGVVYCPSCQVPVRSQSLEEITERLMRSPERTKLIVLAPLVRNKKGEHHKTLENIEKDGYVRVRIDGASYELSDVPELNPQEKHTIEAVIDRLVIKPGLEERLRESLEAAARMTQGACVVSHQVDGEWADEFFHTRIVCPNCLTSYAAPTPAHFNHRSAVGACESCAGTGRMTSGGSSGAQLACPTCEGTRLNKFAAAVQFQERTLPKMLASSIDDCLDFVRHAMESLPDEAASRLLQQLLSSMAGRLEVLSELGLGYLALDRSITTLSGGEYQRVRLGACLSSRLSGICYILDEPTTGLHHADRNRLLDLLREQIQRGNSIIAVEHDLSIIEAADYLVELGPGAGIEGGRLVAQGKTSNVLDDAESVTGSFLRFDNETRVRKRNDAESFVELKGCRRHNLKEIDVRLPLGRFVGVTGVSGSGKSSLVSETLVPVVKALLNETSIDASLCRDAEFDRDAVRSVRHLGQRSMGKSARSRPVTYTKIWKEICQLFARTKEAKLRGFQPSRFSLTSAAGTCPKCRGRGEVRLKQREWGDMFVPCPVCHGRSFNPLTMSVRYRGKSIGDVLQMSFTEANEFFANFSRIATMTSRICGNGLGYLKLGQPMRTLSGGEAQRLQLAAALGDASQKQLIVLDEPSSGLHAMDIQRLLEVIDRLVEAGHSVVVVEHHLQVVSAADWILDLGPGPGAVGGSIVVEGTVRQVREHPTSVTGRALKAWRW